MQILVYWIFFFKLINFIILIKKSWIACNYLQINTETYNIVITDQYKKIVVKQRLDIYYCMSRGVSYLYLQGFVPVFSEYDQYPLEVGISVVFC